MIKLSSFLLLLQLFSDNGWSQIPPREIFRQHRDAVCRVSFYQNIASDSKIGSFDKIKKYCTGIVVDSTGLIMVSNEVYPVSLDFISIGGSLLSGLPTDFEVRMAGGREYAADFLGKDDQAMVAFIQIKPDDSSRTFPFVHFKSDSRPEMADTVFVMELLTQNYDFSPLFTPHTVNAVVEAPKLKYLINNYNPALSAGGLVLNARGIAIGVVLSQTFNFMGDGDFEEYQKKYLEIAPAEWFIHLIKNPPNLKENQLAQKSWLGIQMQALTKELREYWEVPQEGGVIINRVFSESPAARAKLADGDIILAIDDSVLAITKDEETDQFRNMILSIAPGTIIQLKIFRNKKIITRKTTLAASPKAIGLAEKYQVPGLGFEIRELTRDIIYQDNLPLETPGVFVFQVDRASPAGIGGLAIGDIIQEINGEEVKHLEDARKIISRFQEQSQPRYMLKILSNRATGFVFLDLGK